MPMPLPEFPAPIRIRQRLYWRRGELEAYKRALFHRTLGAVVEVADESRIHELVPTPQVAKEFGVTRRTIGRLCRGRVVEIDEVA